MEERRLIRLFRFGFFLAYLFALIMSTAHLMEWYALSLGGLPKATALGLAASLEFAAFLLSVASNTYLGALPTARVSAYVALGLVWVGNFLAITRAAAGLPVWEAFLQSLFVPVSTMAVGKVIGELYRLEKGMGERSEKGFHREELLTPMLVQASGTSESFPYRLSEEEKALILGILGTVPSGLTQDQLGLYVSLPQEHLAEALEKLRREGILEEQGGVWKVRGQASSKGRVYT